MASLKHGSPRLAFPLDSSTNADIYARLFQSSLVVVSFQTLLLLFVSVLHTYYHSFNIPSTVSYVFGKAYLIFDTILLVTNAPKYKSMRHETGT